MHESMWRRVGWGTLWALVVVIVGLMAVVAVIAIMGCTDEACR